MPAQDLKRKSVKDRVLHSCIILELPFETTPSLTGARCRDDEGEGAERARWIVPLLMSTRRCQCVALPVRPTIRAYPASLRRCVAPRSASLWLHGVSTHPLRSSHECGTAGMAALRVALVGAAGRVAAPCHMHALTSPLTGEEMQLVALCDTDAQAHVHPPPNPSLISERCSIGILYEYYGGRCADQGSDHCGTCGRCCTHWRRGCGRGR